MKTFRDSSVKIYSASAVFFLTFLLFSLSIEFDFVNWDDHYNFLLNPYYRGFSWENLKWMWFSFYLGHYTPITWMTFALDYVLWGLNPHGYHFMNILIHSLNAVFVFLLTQKIIRMKASFPSQKIILVSLFSALFFSLHPLRVESVAWVTERRDVLSAFFFLGALLSYFYYRQSLEGKAKRQSYFLVLVVTLLCLFSKAIGILIPVVFLLMDFFVFQDLKGKTVNFKSLLGLLHDKWVFFFLSGIFSFLAMEAQVFGHAAQSLEDYTLLDRIFQSFYGLTFYIQKTIFPFFLSPLYILPERIITFGIRTFVAVLFFFGITFLALKNSRRFPILLGSWLYYIFLLLPVLGLFQSGPQYVADRYSYLSCLPVGPLLALGAMGWAKDVGFKKIIVSSLFVVGLGGVSFLTITQLKIWSCSETLWEHALQTTPSYMAASNLGEVYSQRKEWQKAEEAYRRAFRTGVANRETYFELIESLRNQQKKKQAETLYKQAIRSFSGNSYLYGQYGEFLKEEGRIKEAEEFLKKAFQLQGTPAESIQNLALLLLEKGQKDEALKVSLEGVKKHPKNGTLHYNAAYIHQVRGENQEALDHYQKALQHNPFLGEAHSNLGGLLVSMGREKQALKHFETAVVLQPHNATCHFNLGLFLMKEGKKKRGRQYLARAVELNPRLASKM